MWVYRRNTVFGVENADFTPSGAGLKIHVSPVRSRLCPLKTAIPARKRGPQGAGSFPNHPDVVVVLLWVTRMADWLPKIPPRLAKRLALFTAHRDGLVRRHGDEIAFVCGRAKFLAAFNDKGATEAIDLVEQLWEAKRVELDALAEGRLEGHIATAGRTLIELLSEFYANLDRRVETGMPKRMSSVTAWDMKRTLNAFGVTIGPDLHVNAIGPDHFTRYAKSIASEAATTIARKVAYVEAFIRWALGQGRLADNRFVRKVLPGMDAYRSLVGSDLVKPAKSDMDDERLEKEKSFEPVEIAKLWAVASHMERIWIGLALNGAADNADVMHMPRSVIRPADDKRYKGVFAAGVTTVVDYRRRKRGRRRRVYPLAGELAELIALYQRPSPAEGVDDDLMFLQDDGTPLFKQTAAGPQNIVTRKFTRLLVRAGLRAAPADKYDGNIRTVTSAGSGDGRGFRSLRTTFANLAPAGFRDEVEIVMGHAHGQVLLDRYLEKNGFSRLSELVTSVWKTAFSERPDAAWYAQTFPRVLVDRPGSKPYLRESPSVAQKG